MTLSATELAGDGIADSGPAPLYLRLQERLRSAIQAGELKPGDTIPTERDLASAFRISRVTVRKALVALVAEEILVQRQGSGTFVSAPRRLEQAASRLTSFSDEMRLRGLAPGSRWLSQDISAPTPEEAMRLSLSPTDSVWRMQRVRLAAGTPMAFEVTVVPIKFLPDITLVRESLYAALDSVGYRPVRGLQRLRAVNLSSGQAELLGLATGMAALSIDRLSYCAGGDPVESTHSIYRGEAYDFVAELK